MGQLCECHHVSAELRQIVVGIKELVDEARHYNELIELMYAPAKVVILNESRSCNAKEVSDG